MVAFAADVAVVEYGGRAVYVYVSVEVAGLVCISLREHLK